MFKCVFFAKESFFAIFYFLSASLIPFISHATIENDIAAFQNNQVFLYDTKAHPKAKGIHLTIPYPKSWIAEEGRHPNVVQKFKTDIGNHTVLIEILIKNSLTNKNFTSEQINNEDFRKNCVEELGNYFESGPTQVDGENAIWIFHAQEVSFPSFNIEINFLTYIVNYSGKQIFIMNGVGGIAGDPTIKETFYSYLPLFQAITSHVIFPDKWKN